MTESDYRKLVREHLQRLSTLAVAQLSEVLAQPVPAEAAVLDVEVSAGNGFFDGLPVSLFFMTSDGGAQLSDSVPLLRDGTVARWPAQLRQRLLALDESGTFDGGPLEAAELLDWFPTVWDLAGGQRYPLRAYLCFHDDDRSFDLKAKTWVSDDAAKWVYR